MGQKINPTGLRLGIIKGWESSWYGGKNFSEKIVEDYKIRIKSKATEDARTGKDKKTD